MRILDRYIVREVFRHAFLGLVVFMVHLTGAGGLQGIQIGKSSGSFFFVWTLLALAVVSLLSLTLSAHGLWGLLRSKAKS